MDKKIIEEYVHYKQGKVLTIDFEKKEFEYQTEHGKIKGFFNNVEEWYNSLITIENKKYMVQEWFRQKNKIDFECLLLGEGDKINIKRETEKAFLLTNNANTEMWIPKSVLIEVKE